MQYTIVSAESNFWYEAINKVEEKVKELAASGYKLKGGISITSAFVGDPMYGKVYYTVVQAMVKED